MAGDADAEDDLRSAWRVGLKAVRKMYEGDTPLEAQFGPGTFGEHELLDRLSLMQGMWDDYISSHPATDLDFERFRLARRVSDLIADLYQLVGSTHMGSETSA